eukprot:484806-Pelagomonas_calceolata.AAC.2
MLTPYSHSSVLSLWLIGDPAASPHCCYCSGFPPTATIAATLIAGLACAGLAFAGRIFSCNAPIIVCTGCCGEGRSRRDPQGEAATSAQSNEYCFCKAVADVYRETLMQYHGFMVSSAFTVIFPPPGDVWGLFQCNP